MGKGVRIMHMIIRIIVYASSQREAVAAAEAMVEGLVEVGVPFDDYAMFRDGWIEGRAAPRGAYPSATLATSTEGKRLLREGWAHTRADFRRAVAIVRNALDWYSDDEFFENKVVTSNGSFGLFRYFCAALGQSAARPTWLYDGDGNPIDDRLRLRDTLAMRTSPPRNRKRRDKRPDVWVVPVWVHF